MKITKYLMTVGVVAAMAMTACSSDEPETNIPAIGSNDSFYATVSLSLPTLQGSRSQTDTAEGDDYVSSTDKQEVGKDYENNIKSILVILATHDGNDYVLQTVNQGDASNNTTDSSKPSYTVKFDNGAVLSLAGKKIYPFVVCNPDAALVGQLEALNPGDKTFVDKVMSIGDPDNFSGWLSNNFLMTNAYMDVVASAVEMPSEAELKTYTKPSTPFNLTNGNPVKVERSVARMDFKNTKKDDADTVNKYVIYSDASNRTDIVGYVTLTDMALINQARDFYTFRRVSANGTETGWNICGVETPFNYVVSPLSDNPALRAFTLAGFADGSAVAPESLAFTPISNVTGTETDYKIWRYVTENTIPAPTDNQRKGITTGVVFKGNMTFPAESALQAMASNGDALYKFGKVIYGNYDALVAEIKANPNTLLAAKAKAAGLYTGIDSDGELENLQAESSINADGGVTLSQNGFTVYRPDSTGNYPVFYYYWNRHNDNLDSNKMGAMEFGVVRNNVYKLAVSNISEFGHPGKPGDDPDPEDPDDEDETVDLYIKLDVQVLPWTVRVNDIEF